MAEEIQNPENEIKDKLIDQLIYTAENLRFGLKARVEEERRLVARHIAKAEALQIAYEDVNSFFIEARSRAGKLSKKTEL
jgi:hypothetical protein